MTKTPRPDADRVSSRAENLTAEEDSAGIDDPRVTAEAILSESDERSEDRAGTSREHRRSEDTVEPPPG